MTQKSATKYCVKCGKQIASDTQFCPYCGTGCGQAHINAQTPNKKLLQELSTKYNTNGIIWLVIGCLQVLAGIAGLLLDWFILIVGVLNIISATQDIRYSKTLLNDPSDIVEKVTPLAGPIIILIYNLIFGGIIGVAGSIYYLIAIRGYVLEHETEFKQLAGPSIPLTNH